MDNDFRVVPVGTRGSVLVNKLNSKPTSRGNGLSLRCSRYKPVPNHRSLISAVGLLQLIFLSWQPSRVDAATNVSNLPGITCLTSCPGPDGPSLFRLRNLLFVCRPPRPIHVPSPDHQIPDPRMTISSETRRERNILTSLLSRSASLHRLCNSLLSPSSVPNGVKVIVF